MQNSKMFFYLAMILTLITIVAAAWTGDDVFFTLRTIVNFLHGEGLRWNIEQRVQAFTHPLWLLVLSPFCWLSGEEYLTTIAISLVFTLGFILIVFTLIVRDYASAFLATLILLFSKSFLDYTTSGLENPLAYFLLACFYLQYVSLAYQPYQITLLFLSASLLLCTRFDFVILIAPALAVVSWKLWRKPNLGRFIPGVLLGLMPIGMWLLFSLLYYGYALPNTYYAKTHHGIAHHEIFAQGLAYLAYTLTFDPLTLLVIVVGILLAAVKRVEQTLVMSIAITCYLAYIISVGGDFMGGRFLSPPLVIALLSLCWHANKSWSEQWYPLLAIIILLFASFPPHANLEVLWRGSGYEEKERVDSFHHKIINERRFYFKDYGLINNFNHYLKNGLTSLSFCSNFSHQVAVCQGPGVWGYLSQPDLHIIDPLGLADPLLAHLHGNIPWRIGHFERELPQGYLESREAKKNLLQDPSLREYFAIITLLTEGEVFSWKRLQAIVRQNLGFNEHLLVNYQRTTAREIPLARLGLVKDQGTYWGSAANITMEEGGERLIRLTSPLSSHKIQVGLDCNDRYELIFSSAGGETLYATQLGPQGLPCAGITNYLVDLPETLNRTSIDTVTIRPLAGDQLYAIGHFVPL